MKKQCVLLLLTLFVILLLSTTLIKRNTYSDQAFDCNGWFCINGGYKIGNHCQCSGISVFP